MTRSAPRRRARPAALLALALAVLACDGGPTTPDIASGDLSAPWPTSSPAAQAFDVAALDAAFQHAADVDNLRALVVVRNGYLVRQAYFGGTHPDDFLDLRSVTKTVMALLVGIAADSGYLDIDDPIADWLDGHALGPEHDGIRIRHLLTMTSGIRWTDRENFAPWALSERWVDYVLELPVVAEPGESFIYNTGGSHLLSVIVGRAVGRSAYDFALERLLEPLGIRDADFTWWVLGQDPNGGAGFAPRATDAARIGQLLLQEGRSGDRQVVSAEWVARSTERHLDFGGPVGGGVLDRGGYGFQLWLDTDPEAWVAWGYGGQFIWVVPSRRLVVVAATRWGGIGYDRAGDQARAVAALIADRIVPAAR